jgi:hypothetical protein
MTTRPGPTQQPAEEAQAPADEKKSHGYAIDAIETAKSKTPQRKAAKDQVLPKFPFSMMISGSSGSGKTNLMINIMTRPDLYGQYFHRIAVFSPTAGSSDDLYKKLGLPDGNYVPDMKPEHLENIIAYRKEQIAKKGIEWVSKNDRMILILDDVIANRAFLESEAAIKMFALLRHFLVSVIVMVQSYNKLPRTLRVNANAVMVFPALQSEIDVLKDEITPPGISKRDFGDVIKYATEGRYDFLYINRHADPGKRVRKNLDEIINVADFVRDSARAPSYSRQAAHDVTANRRHVEGHEHEGSGPAGSRRPTNKSGHPGQGARQGEQGRGAR